MNPREQEIWKRCMNGFQLKKKIGSHHGPTFMIVKFKGEFEYNSPIYHVFFYGKHHIHRKEHKGWTIDNTINFTEREQKDNDPRFPIFFNYFGFRPGNTRKTVNLFFDQIRNKLKFCTRPSDKIIHFLKQNVPFPDELISLICSNFMITELEWLERKIEN